MKVELTFCKNLIPMKPQFLQNYGFSYFTNSMVSAY